MPWVKLDEQFSDHPKVLQAGPLGMALQVAALCYCNRHTTGGALSRQAAASLLSFEGLGMRLWSGEVAGGGEDATWELVAGDLVAVGMWHEPGHDCPDCPAITSGFYLHDYLDYQPSKAEVEAARAAKQEAGRKGGRASAQARAQAPATANGQAPAQAESKPDPVPDTDKDTEPPLPPHEPSRGLSLVPPTVSPPATDPVRIVFDAWRESTGHRRAKLDGKRRQCILRALQHYPVDDCIDAVRGWRHSRHHTGRNANRTVYDELTLLLRDAEHIERFRDLERGERRAAAREPKSWDVVHSASERLVQAEHA